MNRMVLSVRPADQNAMQHVMEAGEELLDELTLETTPPPNLGRGVNGNAASTAMNLRTETRTGTREAGKNTFRLAMGCMTLLEGAGPSENMQTRRRKVSVQAMLEALDEAQWTTEMGIRIATSLMEEGNKNQQAIGRYLKEGTDILTGRLETARIHIRAETQYAR